LLFFDSLSGIWFLDLWICIKCTAMCENMRVFLASERVRGIEAKILPVSF